MRTEIPDHITSKSLAPEPSSNPTYPVAPSGYQPPQNVRPPSSIYTDPHYSRIRESQSEYTDVSPPESPTYGGGPTRGSPDISPIEDGQMKPISNPRQETKFTSSLPIPRNRLETGTGSGGTSQPSAKNEGYTSPHDNPRTTRWDDFSGEPTSSDKGKMAQASPRTSSLNQPPAPETSSRHQFNILAKGRELNQARRRLMEKRQPDPVETSPAQRQPWKGASGRDAIVNPIRPKPRSGAEPPKPLPKPDVRPRQASASSPRPPEVSQSPATTEPQAFRPRTSSKAGYNALALSSSAAPSGQKTIDSSHDGDQTPPAHNPYFSHENSLPNPSSNPSTHTIKPAEAPAPNYTEQFQNLALHENPSSRFSVSTYATSPPESPRQSVDINAPPVPAIPPTMASKKFPLNSAASIRSVKNTTRKPTPSQISMTTTGTGKDLPQCPPEMEARDRVDTLQAKLDALSRRRANIGTIIHELTQVVQPSSIAYDMATRDEVKKTVTSLNNELDDIKKEEHDLGLKLLKAWKKRDEDDIYHESSSLWVKRVTS